MYAAERGAWCVLACVRVYVHTERCCVYTQTVVLYKEAGVNVSFDRIVFPLANALEGSVIRQDRPGCVRFIWASDSRCVCGRRRSGVRLLFPLSFVRIYWSIWELSWQNASCCHLDQSYDTSVSWEPLCVLSLISVTLLCFSKYIRHLLDRTESWQVLPSAIKHNLFFIVID